MSGGRAVTCVIGGRGFDFYQGKKHTLNLVVIFSLRLDRRPQDPEIGLVYK